MADQQNQAMAPGQLVLIYPADTYDVDPLRRHLLTGRVEAVDDQGVRLRPFASDADTFQDYDSFVPWASVGLATVVTQDQLPQMRRVLNDSITRALREAVQAGDGEPAFGRL